MTAATLVPDRFADRLRKLRAEPSSDVPGDGPRLARVGRTREEMMVQGAAIRATLERTAPDLAALAERVRARGISQILILGCGDSWFAGLAAAPIMERITGLPCLGLQAFEHAVTPHPGLNRGALAIGISSGGNTPAVMDALHRARAEGAFTVGLSNTPGSPITVGFDGALLVEASRKGWPTQSTTATIALLVALACAIGAGGAAKDLADLAELPAIVDGAMADVMSSQSEAGRAMAHAAQVMSRAPMVLFTGAHADFAVASVGAAKLRELSSQHAFAVPLEEMHHYRWPKERDHLVLIATEPKARERALDTAIVARSVGAWTLAVLAEPDPDISELVQAVVLRPEARGPLGVVPSLTTVHALAYQAALARSEAGLGGPWD